MNLRTSRVLSPLERFSEIVFGLIMVLSFTCALSVADVGSDDVRAMLIGAIGCNLAWGLIDAVFYLIGCVSEAGHSAALLRNVQQMPDRDKAISLIAEALPSKVAEILRPSDYARLHAELLLLPAPVPVAKLTAENWRGAAGVFLLVFVSTLPVVVPFVFIQEAALALRISNAIAIVLLFGAGQMLARYAGFSRVLAGVAMVGVGAGLVALAIALGG